ncbi:bleomycin resistance protein [Terasakiella pusilla]|jgi:catechol 2,3-dioxygenase-like lactoylglutathione lyase family enzyme|uniref:bleomycin resistance protein n=1 Tax=Terasakiella pusilla TaxID=64973 RepID=UPI00048FF5FB|nr:VOC family protein [Terasakiella pusilla]
MDYAVAIPILPSLNIARTKEFYVSQLGFEAVFQQAESFLIVKRDQIELHFWLTDDKGLPPVSSCYIRGGQIAILHDEYASKDVPNLSRFEERPWGMKEFYVHDLDGNLLRFGMIPEEA